MFKLSDKSLAKLSGVDAGLQNVVKTAITITDVDFGITEGLRSIERQKELVATGKSQTLQSNHIIGKAVDLVAYVDGKVSWELRYYYEIAHAMRVAAIQNKVPIRWGGAWQIHDIREWPTSMKSANDNYVEQRRALGKNPFIDSPHFEIGLLSQI